MFINNNVKMERSSQDKMTDMFINLYYNKDVKFLSSFVKYASMTWKGNRYLNVGKKINIFGEYKEGFINYNSWKESCIDVHSNSDYSNSDNKNRKLIMDDLMNELSGKIIRLVDDNYSIFMSDQEIRNSVQMRFKNHGDSRFDNKEIPFCMLKPNF